MNILHIERPGMFSVIQDIGRWGAQRLGVPVNGPMDETAHRMANMLVGNTPDAAALECTLTGPSFRLSANAVLAFTGADFRITAGEQTVPLNRAVMLRAGVRVTVQERRKGARIYIAIRGGIATPPVLGSRSTFLRGQFGGLDGRALRAGDRVPVGHVVGPTLGLEKLLIQSGMPLAVAGEIDGIGTCQEDADTALRVIRGPQWRAFEHGARRALVCESFSVSNQSDRMGYRISGPSLRLRAPLEMISEAVNVGTIQVPPDGNPIVLMADRQTAGGYPKIGYVPTADLWRLAQALPGDALRFKVVSNRQAERALLNNEDRMARIGQDAARALN